MKNRLIIIGAAGHGRVIAESAQLQGRYQFIEFLDDSYPNEKESLHWPIVGEIDDWHLFLNQADFIVAINVNKYRNAMSQAILEEGGSLATIVHPSAVVSPNAQIGNGTMICANATINIGAIIGVANIVNTGASVDHDCTLANGVHISPGSRIASQVEIAENVWVGIGATINESLAIGENTIIGGGASVIHDAKKDSLYVGVPAIKK